MTNHSKLPALFLLCAVLLSGCAANIRTNSASQPIAKFLAPVSDSRLATQKTPLQVPASVAIVVVPGQGPGSVPATSLRLAAEQMKTQLAAHSKYVKSVAIVTADDAASPLSLERIKALYAADIAILISHQQSQGSQQNSLLGLLDATIVGAYVVPGVQIRTATFVDGKIIHIPSNAIIFRASGQDSRTTLSTSYSVRGNAGEDSTDSLIAASANFGKELDKVIAKFDQYDLSHAVPLTTLASETEASGGATRPANDYWQSVDNYKSSGGGALNAGGLALALLACTLVWRRK